MSRSPYMPCFVFVCKYISFLCILFLSSFFFTLLSIYQMASTYSYFVPFILILTCIYNIKGAKTCQGEDNQYLCMFYFMCLWIYYDNHNVIIHKRKSCTSLTRFSQWVSPRPWAKRKIHCIKDDHKYGYKNSQDTNT